MTIFVGNVSTEVTEKNLQQLFEPFGEVISVKIMTDVFTRRSRGFAFIEMADRTIGELAIEKLNNTSFHQKSLIVNEAKPKTSDFKYSTSKNRGGQQN